MQRKQGRELYLCSEMVGVVVDPSRTLPANLEEISERSFVLLLDEELPRGASVRVVCKSQILDGVVETLHPDELLGWYIRVRLTAGPIDLEPFIAANLTSHHAVYAPQPAERVVHLHAPKVRRTKEAAWGKARVKRIPVRAVRAKSLTRGRT